MKEHYLIFLTIESSISRDGFVVVCICFIFTFEHYFILLQQLIVESGCDPTVSSLQRFLYNQSVQKELQPLLYISQVPSTLACVNFDIYSIFVSYSKTNKQKSADNRISERKSGPFIYCFFSNDRSRTDCWRRHNTQRMTTTDHHRESTQANDIK